MTEQSDDLGISMASTSKQSTLPSRAHAPHRPGNLPGNGAASPLGTRSEKSVERRNLIVGREISLSGDISACDRMVVEGSAEVTVHDCQEVEIAEGGFFKGTAQIEHAEVRGRFEGELTVHKRLLIRATGSVSGTITYGEIEIERGGKVSGTIQAHS